jgi:ABC-type Fe3+-hydroxamate transport system substrate-binding protein
MPQLMTIRVLILAGFLAACVTPTPATTPGAGATLAPTTNASPVDGALFPLTVTDAIGQEFTFDAPPKIGCLWYGCYEALADLGIPPAAGLLPEVELASIFYAPAGPPTHLVADDSNPENWAATGIDLLMTRVPDSADLDAMRQAAPIFFLHHPSYGESDQQGYAAYIENLRILGQLTGQPAAAENAIARFETTLAPLKSLATPETAELRVAVLFSGEGYGGLAPSSPFCAVLAEVGLGRCVEAAEGAAWLELNAEQFLALDPDWIVYLGFGVSHTERTDPVWSQLTAVKEGRVFDAVGHRYYCCSARGLIHSLQDYVSHILPEAGIPAPGPVEAFDPEQSPLVQP